MGQLAHGVVVVASGKGNLALKAVLAAGALLGQQMLLTRLPPHHLNVSKPLPGEETR